MYSLVHFWTKFIQYECKVHDKTFFFVFSFLKHLAQISNRHLMVTLWEGAIALPLNGSAGSAGCAKMHFFFQSCTAAELKAWCALIQYIYAKLHTTSMMICFAIKQNEKIELQNKRLFSKQVSIIISFCLQAICHNSEAVYAFQFSCHQLALFTQNHACWRHDMFCIMSTVLKVY